LAAEKFLSPLPPFYVNSFSLLQLLTLTLLACFQAGLFLMYSASTSSFPNKCNPPPRCWLPLFFATNQVMGRARRCRFFRTSKALHLPFKKRSSLFPLLVSALTFPHGTLPSKLGPFPRWYAEETKVPLFLSSGLLDKAIFSPKSEEGIGHVSLRKVV